MISIAFLVPLLFGSPSNGGKQDTVLSRRLAREGIVIEFAPTDSAIAANLVGTLGSGRSAIQAFFDGPYRTAFTVRIFPNRTALTVHWANAWRVPDLKTECWMVASGVGDELALLSPRVWDTEACEHSTTDTASTRRVLWHELVHVYHGQHNPRPSFDGMDDLGWFVEGVAVLASGQLAAEHEADARAAIAANRAPAHLAEAWSGRWRYGVSGSLVGYLDALRGRRTVIGLLADTSQVAMLSRVRLTEQELLTGWRTAASK